MFRTIWRFRAVDPYSGVSYTVEDAALPSRRHGLCGRVCWFPSSSSAARSRAWSHGAGKPCFYSLLVRTADGRPLPTDNHKPITSRTWACYVHIFIIIIKFIFIFCCFVSVWFALFMCVQLCCVGKFVDYDFFCIVWTSSRKIWIVHVIEKRWLKAMYHDD